MQAPALESVSFIVWGPPQPKERARRDARGRWYTPKRTRRYEQAVRASAVCALGTIFVHGNPNPWRRDGLYRLTVEAVFADRRRRDADNVLKSVADALNAIGYDDDSQVVETRTAKSVNAGNPCTEVLLERIGDAPRKARRA